MRTRIAAMLLLASLSACRASRDYAVYASRDAIDDRDGCFRACQLTRNGDGSNYVACLRACPDATVVEERNCESYPLPSDAVCMQETVSRVSAGKTVWMVLGVIAAVSVVAQCSNGGCQSQK